MKIKLNLKMTFININKLILKIVFINSFLSKNVQKIFETYAYLINFVLIGKHIYNTLNK